jgi:tetratricopeptide (TPR) repeat protein
MSLQKTDALIDHLDESFTTTPDSVSPEASATMQRLIAEDEDTAKEWLYLQLAVDSIQDAGLREQVATVRKQWETQTAATREAQVTATPESLTATQDQPTITTTDQTTADSPVGVVRNLYRNMMRIAACAVLIAGGACIFKYVRLSSSSLYSEYYTSYEINTSRGNASRDAIEKAYIAKNWSEVLALFSPGKDRSNKTDFLAGLADLELKRFDDAIAHFEQIIASNSHSGGDYFEDEAEYYLAISWLAKDKVNEAMPILEKIRANKDHLYHDKVAKMSFTDLRLVQYKENK